MGTTPLRAWGESLCSLNQQLSLSIYLSVSVSVSVSLSLSLCPCLFVSLSLSLSPSLALSLFLFFFFSLSLLSLLLASSPHCSVAASTSALLRKISNGRHAKSRVSTSSSSGTPASSIQWLNGSNTPSMLHDLIRARASRFPLTILKTLDGCGCPEFRVWKQPKTARDVTGFYVFSVRKSGNSLHIVGRIPY